MATKKTSKASSTASKPKARPKSTPAPAPSRAEQARSAAETAVDVPVGVVLEVSDRVTELVEPFSGRSAAEKQFKSYGTRLRRTVKRSERRGAVARRKASRAIDERSSRAQDLVGQVSDQLATLR